MQTKHLIFGVTFFILISGVAYLINGETPNPTQGSGFLHAKSAKVTKIIDGDTVLASVLTSIGDQKEMPLELSHIDAPEREQPLGRESKHFLEQHILGKEVLYKTHANKQEIFYQGANINLKLVSEGFAWVAQDVANYPDNTQYMDAQTLAITSTKGIWGLEHELRVTPWQWRKQATEQRSMRPIQRKPMQQTPAFIGQTQPPVQLQNMQQNKPPSSPKKAPEDKPNQGNQ